MNLPIIIGKESNNDILQVDLKNLPHLFISYSEKEHIELFLNDTLNRLIQHDILKKLQFACALSKEMYSGLNNYLKDAKQLSLFIRNETIDPASGSKFLFMRTLMKELKRRQKIKQLPGKNSSKNPPPLIVLIDDIFDIIITKRKYTGVYFLELLANGKELDIHFIVASTWTYRSLFSQLIKSKLAGRKSSGKESQGNDHPAIQPLIAELIINAEDFYFFKESGQINYKRYFPIREGLERFDLSS